jgi:hypothetical protein
LQFCSALWDLGHRLFRTTPETYPAHFIEGDVFDPDFLSPILDLSTSTSPSRPHEPLPDLKSLTSLNPLRGRVSAILAISFFHLFTEDQQHQLATALAGLLSPEPGSVIFGVHGGRAEKGFWQPTAAKMFCHSPESWAALWHGVFRARGAGKVEVKVTLRKEIGGDDYFGMYPGNKNPFHVIEWSVTRI